MAILIFPPCNQPPTNAQINYILLIQSRIPGAKFEGKTFDDAALFIDTMTTTYPDSFYTTKQRERRFQEKPTDIDLYDRDDDQDIHQGLDWTDFA